MSRPFNLFRPSLLAASIALGGLSLNAVAETYQLPAAPLASTLNKIASEAGIVLSIEPSLTAGKTAQPVNGDYAPLTALSQALKGSGLQLVQSSAGTYSLAPASAGALSLPTTSINSTGVQSDGSAEVGYVTENVRNVGALGGMRLQDTPYSISVVSKEMLQNTQTTSMDDVFKRNPFTQLFSPQNAGYASAVAMRGFGAAGNLSIANDGLRYSTTSDSGNFVEEMEQVEILTGLSGFLYGPASPGGLVNYVLKRPTAERYNSVTLGNAGGENYYLHGDFGGPIDDQGVFGYRLNVLTQDGETAIDMQKRRRQMVTLALDWNVSDDLLIQFEASHKKNNVRGLNSYWYFADGSRRPDAKDLSNDKLYSQKWAFADNEQDRVGSRFNWTLNDIFTLRGAASYAEYTTEYTYTGPTVDQFSAPVAGTYGQPLYAFAPEDISEASAYLFLDSTFETGPLEHKLTTGYQGNRTRTERHEDHIPVGFQYVSVVGGGSPIPISTTPQVDKPGYSIGNQAQHIAATSTMNSYLVGDVITINPEWSTVLGVVHSEIRTFANDFVYGGGKTRYDKSETSPNVSIIYKPVSWLTTYATYIEGLQSGGTAPQGANIPLGTPLPPEVSEQYEIGAKATWGDTLFTLALFNIDKPNYITNFVYTPNGRQENTGIEFGVTGKVTPQLTLVGGVTLLDASIKKSNDPANDGKKPTNVASQMAKLYAEYEFQDVPGFALTGGAYYTGKQYEDIANQYSLPSFTTFDAGARYRMPIADNSLTLRANLSNLTNKEYWLNSYYLGDPRTLTFSAQLEF